MTSLFRDVTSARDALIDVGGESLLQFLRRSGWEEVARSKELSYVVVEEPGFPERQVKVPLDRGAPDYLLALQLSVERASSALKLSASELVERLRLEQYDVLSVSAMVDQSDSLPAGHALKILNGAWKTITAAAWAEDVGQGGRTLYRGPWSPRLAQFLASLRFGHTQPGSFRFPILSPLPESPEEEVGFALHVETFERRALRKTVNAVNAAVAAAEELRDQNRFTFVQRLPDGVSANLCQALSQLPGDISVKFEARWSPTAPDKDNVAEVPPGLTHIFEEAAGRLGGEDVTGRIVIVGYVRGLKREPEEAVGEVTIRSTVAGSPGLYRVVLTPENYEAAIEAHDTKRAVLVEGVLERSGAGARYLKDATFAVLGFDFDELDDAWDVGGHVAEEGDG